MAVSPESIQQIVRYPWEKKPSPEETPEKEESLEDSLMEAENYEDDDEGDSTEKIQIKNISESTYNDQNLPDQSVEDQNKNMIHDLAEAEESPKLEQEETPETAAGEGQNEDTPPAEPAVLELKVDKIDDQETEEATEKINIRVAEKKPIEMVESPVVETNVTTAPEVAEIPDENMEKIMNLNKAIEAGKEKFQQTADSEKEKVMEEILPEIIEACEKIKE